MASPEQNALPALHRDTLLAQGGSRWDNTTGAVSMPIYQATTFAHPGPGESTGFDYSRTANPTRQQLEKVLAEWEGGVRALAFSSGLSAVDTVLRLFAPGDTLVVLEDLYGGTFRLLEGVYKAWGLKMHYASLEEFADPQTLFAKGSFKAVFVESPTNPTLKVVDIAKVARAAKARGILTLVDNTFLTAQLQRPLELGADIVLYSGSKYLGGHNDVLAGVAITADSAIGERLAWLQNSYGPVLGAFDSWLLLRGMKTLPLRLARQQENAKAVAEFLYRHPTVAEVHWPGDTSHAGYALHKSQSSGPGAMVSFALHDSAQISTVLRSVRLWIYAESLGGTESLITFPVLQTHADMEPQLRERLGIHNRLLRLSLGVEHAQDLITDLRRALETKP